MNYDLSLTITEDLGKVYPEDLRKKGSVISVQDSLMVFNKLLVF